MQFDNGVPSSRIQGAVWIKSQASGAQGNCVEATALPGGVVALRNSRHPEGPALIYTTAEVRAFLQGAKDGEFDHLVG
ncbi:DUF397 domain-containing protein [Streptomyces sp. R302]|uniref:DUF397 domain-containing protein n=1 Tax=unclassified Streptomyces TaxID=2593676 RepID=UPI00145CC054|nr:MULTISPECIES: DUF397 domain-containing protein [unclassified Streptomyces]NML54753.1 DUF397 domain-containing protein [Streptomyces sp. R301]NML80678.1 DUF397 domain-containing protein [Streptomyces sp. R302]